MKYAIITLGCKVNQYESASLATLMNERGHEESKLSGADAIIINTCAVTGESSRKSRQAIRRARAENADAVIAVCGCFSQVEPKAAASLDADIIFGSSDRKELPAEIERKAAGFEGQILKTHDLSKRREFELLPGGVIDGRVRATLKVEDGCDRFCAYCVIPLARGRVRSMPLSDVSDAARRLEVEGYRELVITGIEISSYGKDIDDEITLADLVEEIADFAPGLRLRIGSLDPRALDERLVRRMANTGKVCPHFHLSLQSGSDEVLSMMGRGYSTKEFYEAAQMLRSHFPGCAISADLITGFPGETAEHHAETLAFIKKCRFASMHVFPFSVRPGTRAAGMSGANSREVKTERAWQARLAAEEMKREYLEEQVGKTLDVIFETGEEMWRGHAGNYCVVETAGEALRGVVTNVKILRVQGDILVGQMFDK